ncbi:MAG TPA: T9SS type A sorting domain-containing protein [Chitinophagaceae bacterium]|nr:T9SS type A sorting domain-containing protein [Chitinophagaceae bacterium]
MKKFFLFPALLCTIFSTASAQYPSSFSWIPNIVKDDQRVQGPCNCFATAAQAEAWYYMLYGQNVGMSVQHLYSPCTSSNGPNTSPAQAMSFMKTTGIVDSFNLTYGNTITDTDPQSVPYFATELGQLANFPCFAPHQIFNQTALPQRLFYIGGYDTVVLAGLYPSLNNIDKLKRILLNYGPVSINFNGITNNNGFHGVTTHDYLLYGWSTSGSNTTWTFKDSWPGSPAVLSYTGDFLALLSNGTLHLNGGPYAFKPVTVGGVTNNAVYVDSLQGSSFVKGNPRRVPYPISGVAIDISGKPSTTPNQYMCNISNALLSIENGSVFDSYTVQWSYKPDSSTSQHGAITFSSPNGNTTYVTVNNPGYVNLYATLTLANGVQVSVSRQKVFASVGIPFQVVKTSDGCSGTTRYARWQVQSIMASNVLPSTITITYPWSFTPAPGTNPSTVYQTTILANDVLNIDYPNLTTPTGYGLHVTLTDAGYNNIVDGATEGASESPCGTGHFAKVVPVVTSVYPNPAHTTLAVQAFAGAGKIYTMRLIDMNGKQVLTKQVNGSVEINISKYARGVYMLQFISSDKKAAPIIHKVVFN